MKIGIFFFGVLLIISAVSEYSLTPMIFDKVNNITNNIGTNMLPEMESTTQNQAYASMITDAKAQASQLTSNITALEIKVTTFTSWGGALIGIGLVSYGILGKNNSTMKTSTEALDILKKRLAKGEITKNQFDQLKNDIA